MMDESVERNKTAVVRVLEEAFNWGELGVIDEVVGADAVDHQHPDVPSFREHLKQVVTALRTAFPDLHFAVGPVIGEGEWVATYSVMTGTQTGPLTQPLLPPDGPPILPPTGRAIRVPHFHLVRFADGQQSELLHLMDTMAMVGQLGVGGGREAGGGRREESVSISG